MLLILTSNKDLAADYLIVQLIRKGLAYFRLNREDITQANFHLHLNQSRITRTISVGSRSVDLNSITAVWYRRSIQPQFDETNLTPAQMRFVSGELRHLAAGIVMNPAITWVNPIDKVSISEHKVFQLQVASKLGFVTPRTIISSDVDEISQFVSQTKLGAIYKPIFHGLYFDGESGRAVYTRRLNLNELSQEALRDCPLLVQEEIHRFADVRATFIGDRYFAADIQGADSLVDWRVPSEDVSYARSSLDYRTIDLCRQMMRELGLVYGAFDFIRTPTGELVFLEINPTGEWAWLEHKLLFPMRDAFVDLFYGERS